MKRSSKDFLSGLESNVYCIKTEPIFTFSVGNVVKGKHIMLRRLWPFKKKKTVPVNNKCSLSVPHHRLVSVTSLLYEQLMHLLPKMGKTQLRRMPLVQSVFLSVWGMDLLKIFWENNITFQSKKCCPVTKHSRHLCFMVLRNELIKYPFFQSAWRGGEARTLTGSEYLFIPGELMAPSCELSNSIECSLERD